MRMITRQSLSDRLWPVRRTAGAGVVVAILAGCSPEGLVGNAPVPTDMRDPAVARTPSGALANYNGALAKFSGAFDEIVLASGLLGDELGDGTRVGDPVGGSLDVDGRILPEYQEPSLAESYLGYVSVYADLQTVRGQAAQAIGLLRDYAPDYSSALRGRLYAVMGYSEVMLAELFCSGIPLSTLDYEGDYTLRPGSSTAEVLQHAVALFDTALALSSDSVRFLDLARIGKGRALLGLGKYAEAAQAVQGVATEYRYDVTYSTSGGSRNFAWIDPSTGTWAYLVSDREGVNGLDYRSSGDPRAASDSRGGVNFYGVTLYHPLKYESDGSSPIVLASGVEARLIEAEAALNAGDASWLGTLNALRATAITPALPDTSDPGNPAARVDLLFRERAFWLFLTGHRQGDMRRLIRQYGRAADAVYAVGSYPGGAGFYGSDVTAPIPSNERYNPLFSGCQSRGA